MDNDGRETREDVLATVSMPEALRAYWARAEQRGQVLIPLTQAAHGLLREMHWMHHLPLVRWGLQQESVAPERPLRSAAEIAATLRTPTRHGPPTVQEIAYAERWEALAAQAAEIDARLPAAAYPRSVPLLSSVPGLPEQDD